MEKDIVPGDPLMELDMETFAKRTKHVSYILQDSTSGKFLCIFFHITID